MPRYLRIHFSSSVPRDDSSNGVYPDWFRGERLAHGPLSTNRWPKPQQNHTSYTDMLLMSTTPYDNPTSAIISSSLRVYLGYAISQNMEEVVLEECQR